MNMWKFYDNMDFTAVAVMARPQDLATYPVNVLVRFVRSCASDISHLNAFYQERLHQLAAPHPPSELQTMHKYFSPVS